MSAESMQPPVQETPMLEVSSLSMHFPVYKGLLRRQVGQIQAVDSVSFSIARGETLGLVGESGCGKSTTGRAILKLYEPTGGKVLLDGQDITALQGQALRRIRPNMQMVFQDPQACLNPRMTVSDIIAEPLLEHRKLGSAERQNQVDELLEAVGLSAGQGNRYPHEFSGGQRQRIGIARALALSPQLVVCDEPIAALDVSIQAQVVKLLESLQQERALTYLFISHDLSMVRYIASRIAVMYLGSLVELGPTEEIHRDPCHPYTRALLSAVPVADPVVERQRKRIILKGEVPSPANPPPGCRFSTRCPEATALCHEAVPKWRPLSAKRHIACHLA